MFNFQEWQLVTLTQTLPATGCAPTAPAGTPFRVVNQDEQTGLYYVTREGATCSCGTGCCHDHEVEGSTIQALKAE